METFYDLQKKIETEIRSSCKIHLNVLPKFQDDSNADIRRLDALARIFKGKNKCVALYYFQDELFVFFNAAPYKPIDFSLADKFFLHLLMLRQNYNLKDLIELVLLNIENLLCQMTIDNALLLDETPLAKSIISLYDEFISQKPLYLEKVSAKIRNEMIDENVWKTYLSSKFSECGGLICAYNSCLFYARSHDGELAKKILRNYNDFNKVIQKFSDLPFHGIKFPLVVDESVHCELQLLQHIDMTDPFVSLMGSYTIGVSKLSCYMCYQILHIYSSINDRTTINFRGTHGKLYIGWRFPKNLKNEKRITEKMLSCLLEEFSEKNFQISDDAERSLSNIKENYIDLIEKGLISDGEWATNILSNRIFL